VIAINLMSKILKKKNQFVKILVDVRFFAEQHYRKTILNEQTLIYCLMFEPNIDNHTSCHNEEWVQVSFITAHI
jgi:hypothetical protein